MARDLQTIGPAIPERAIPTAAGFSKIPHELVHTSAAAGLSHAGWHVLCILRRYEYAGYAPTVGDIAAAFSIPERTTHRALHELRAGGYVKPTAREKNGAVRYQVVRADRYGGWFKLPHELLDIAAVCGLSHAGFRVLCLYLSAENTGGRPGIPAISKTLHMSTRTVDKTQRELSGLGFISAERENPTCTVSYRVGDAILAWGVCHSSKPPYPPYKEKKKERRVPPSPRAHEMSSFRSMAMPQAACTVLEEDPVRFISRTVLQHVSPVIDSTFQEPGMRSAVREYWETVLESEIPRIKRGWLSWEAVKHAVLTWKELGVTHEELEEHMRYHVRRIEEGIPPDKPETYLSRLIPMRRQTTERTPPARPFKTTTARTARIMTPVPGSIPMERYTYPAPRRELLESWERSLKACRAEYERQPGLGSKPAEYAEMHIARLRTYTPVHDDGTTLRIGAPDKDTALNGETGFEILERVTGRRVHVIRPHEMQNAAAIAEERFELEPVEV